MAAVKNGDVVTIRKGRTVKTRMRPDRAQGDLAGTRCVVVGEVHERAGRNGNVAPRVLVAPIESSEEPIGMLDVPVDHVKIERGANALEHEGVADASPMFAGVGPGWKLPKDVRKMSITYKRDANGDLQQVIEVERRED